MATTAAAEAFSISARCSPIPASAVGETALSPQRRTTPAFPPLFRQHGGAPRVSRRLLWRKIRHAVALLVLPAAHLGDNFANRAAQHTGILAAQPLHFNEKRSNSPYLLRNVIFYEAFRSLLIF
jgi:hypothetical protein